jgi:hypothetical protein
VASFESSHHKKSNWKKLEFDLDTQFGRYGCFFIKHRLREVRARVSPALRCDGSLVVHGLVINFKPNKS